MQKHSSSPKKPGNDNKKKRLSEETSAADFPHPGAMKSPFQKKSSPSAALDALGATEPAVSPPPSAANEYFSPSQPLQEKPHVPPPPRGSRPRRKKKQAAPAQAPVPRPSRPASR